MPESIQSPEKAASHKDVKNILAEIERKEQELKEMEKLLTARKENLTKDTEPDVSDIAGELSTNQPTMDALASGRTDPDPPFTEIPAEEPPAESPPPEEASEDDLRHLRTLRREAETKIRELEKKKWEKNRKKAEGLRESYRKEISEFKVRGYNTSRLDAFFLGDIAVLRSEVMKFMGDIRALKELEARLDRYDMRGFEEYGTRLMMLLHDPDRAQECRLLVEEIDGKIRTRDLEERERKKAKIAEIRDQLDMLAEKASLSTHKRKIEDIKQLIYKPDADMDDLAVLSGELARLKQSIESGGKDEDEKHRTALKREIDYYKKKGYRTGIIDNAVRRAPLEDARKQYMVFLTAVNSLESMKKELAGMDTKGFEEDVKRLKNMLRDPSKAEEVRNELSLLKRRLQTKRIKSLAMPKKSTFKCRKCGSKVTITTNVRPLRVECSSCGKIYNLKGKRKGEIGDRVEKKAAKGVEMPPKPPGVEKPKAKEDRSIFGDKPMPGQKPIFGEKHPSTEKQSSEVAPSGEEAIEASQLKTFCPFCGAELLPDSTFCGMCGNNL